MIHRSIPCLGLALLLALVALSPSACRNQEIGNCIGGQTCGQSCTQITSDPRHCGGCGMACAGGQVCSQGACKAACAAGLRSCGGACVDPQSDGAHCGGCGMACAADKMCSAGACVGKCGAGLMNCGGSCVDTSTAGAHCGGCGMACTGGKGCSGGKCACAGTTVDCSGTCADLKAEKKNCGSCGNVCAGSAVCSDGLCATTCGSGLTNCDGSCFDLQKSNVNCGKCGTACTGSKTCAAGACTCPTGQSNCGGTCTDVQTDKANCGMCGMACAGVGAVCSTGLCGSSCGAGLTDCGGSCVDTRTNPSHCGMCGMGCTGGKTCSASTCSCPAGRTECGGACVATMTDNANCGLCGRICTGGKSCSAGLCVCPGGQMDCSGTCKDTTADNANCGACATVCDGTIRTCVASRCECTGGKKDCGGTCVDTAADDGNCGVCGNVCMGGKTCVTSACACTGGQMDCSGTCKDTASDPTACGSCVIACAVSKPFCVASGCAVPPAAPPVIASRWPSVIGWTVGTGGGAVAANRLTFTPPAPPASFPGIRWGCRTYKASTPPGGFIPCDGGTGTTPSYALAKPSATPPDGFWTTEVRYEYGVWTSAFTSITYYVHDSVTGAEPCTSPYTDAVLFAKANDPSDTKHVASTGAFAASIDIEPPFLTVPFTGVTVPPGSMYNRPPPAVGGGWSWQGLTLRKRLAVRGPGNDLVLMIPRYKSKQRGGCDIQVTLGSAGIRAGFVRRALVSCHAVVFNSHGEMACLGTGAGGPVISYRSSNGWSNLGWLRVGAGPAVPADHRTVRSQHMFTPKCTAKATCQAGDLYLPEAPLGF